MSGEGLGMFLLLFKFLIQLSIISISASTLFQYCLMLTKMVTNFRQLCFWGKERLFIRDTSQDFCLECWLEGCRPPTDGRGANSLFPFILSVSSFLWDLIILKIKKALENYKIIDKLVIMGIFQLAFKLTHPLHLNTLI